MYVVEEREENERRDGPRRNRPTVPCYYLRSCGESAFQDPFLPSFLPDALLPSLLRISSRPPFVAAAAACCLQPAAAAAASSSVFSSVPSTKNNPTALHLRFVAHRLTRLFSSSFFSHSSSSFFSSLLPPFAQLFKFRNCNLNIRSLKIEFSPLARRRFFHAPVPTFSRYPFRALLPYPSPRFFPHFFLPSFFLYFFALITSKLSDPTSHGVPVYPFFQD